MKGLMMAGPIDFYFDFSSPFSYFAANKVDQVAEANGRRVDWKPILLGPVFAATGGSSPMNTPQKGAYSLHDCQRMARFMDVAWKMPDNFPILSTAAARAFYWVSEKDPDQARALAKSLFDGYFGAGRDISSGQAVADIAAGLSIDRDQLLNAIAAPAIKQRLKDETARAIERGVFGAPFFFVDGEGFWGSDRLWMVKKWLQRGGW